MEECIIIFLLLTFLYKDYNDTLLKTFILQTSFVDCLMLQTHPEMQVNDEKDVSIVLHAITRQEIGQYRIRLIDCAFNGNV